jgi:type II secretory pathway component GspD/PulD (secretin)
MTGKLRHGKISGSCKTGLVVIISAILVHVSGSFLFCAEQKADSGPAHYRVFLLRHISAQKGKEYLAQMQLGTASQLPGANMLLVTGSPRELIKASAVLQLVDSTEQFVIREVFSASSTHDLPSNEQIAAKVGEVAIGTFSDVPAKAAGDRAIIDLHNEAVIAVASAGHLEKIVSAIKQLQKPESGIVIGEPSLALAEEVAVDLLEQATSEKPSDINDVNDEFFSNLLNSLAEAEKRAAGQAQEVGRPNEANVPSEPTVGPEPPPVVAARPEAEDLAAVLERLKALEAKIEAGPEPNEPKVVTVKIEQPNEVTAPVPKVRYQPESISDANEILQVNLPQSLTIIEFLDLVTKTLQLDYMYDPAKVKGNVHIKFEGGFKKEQRREDLYDLLQRVMAFNGLVMTRSKNLLMIVPEAEVDKIDARFVHEEAGKIDYGDVTVTRIFNLQHTDTATAKNLLTTMQLGLKDKIREVPEIGRLIVTGFAYRMPRIEELLKMIDQPGEPKEFRFKPLRFTEAKTLAPKVKTLVEQLEEEISISVGAGAAAPAAVKRKKGESAAAYRRRAEAAKRAAGKRGAPAAAKPGKPSLYLDFDERTNRVLMIGYESELDIVEQFIESLDVPQTDLRTLRSYVIENIDAEEVRNKLAELEIIGGATTTTRKGTTTKPTGPAKSGAGPRPTRGTTTTTTTEGPLVEQPQVVIIESTNSLLVNATDEQHAQIVMIIGYLDSETMKPSIPYVIYPLENQDPTKLEGVLNQLVKETLTGKDAKGAKIETTRKKIEEDVTIIADPETYSLIVYASKKNQQWISSLIEELDQYRPQVLLDATLVEVTKSEEFSYSLNIIQSFPDLIYKSPFTEPLAGEGAGAITTSDIIDLLDTSGRDRLIDMQSNSGDFTGFYGDYHVNALLELMQRKGYGRVLAKPKLLVNDNMPGTLTADETTYIERTETTFIPGTDPGTSTPVEKQIFDAYTAGIALDIKPHISKGDQLRLEITLTRSDFRLEEVATGKPPDTVATAVTTVVTVPDNKTVILGGLERISQSKGGTKVPIVGDIPIIGTLFRSVSASDKQARLYVFVKAHIVRPGEKIEGLSDIEAISLKNRATFEKYEKEMQEYEDFPGIKPTPMDPLKILEAD